MGASACRSTPSESTEIKKHMSIAKMAQAGILKFLMLGSGSSGKSTIFNQLRVMYGRGFDADQIVYARAAIRQNLLDGMLKLVCQSKRIVDDTMDIDPNDPKICAAVQTCVDQGEYKFYSHDKVVKVLPEDTMVKLGSAIQFLWGLELIRETHSLRGAGILMFSFPANMEYFFVKSEAIFKYHYVPTNEDVLRARWMTSAIKTDTYEIGGNDFSIIDVGGQRSERSKWLHLFDDVDAIIYVAALDHFAAALVENETVNAMHESLKLFGTTFNNPKFNFKRMEIILFLNRKDLMKKALKAGHTLKDCFHSTQKWHGDQWDADEEQKGGEFEMVDFSSAKDVKSDTALFEQALHSAIAFIKAQYLKQIKNEDKREQIYVHITTALNKKNMKKVFWDTQHVIITEGLRRGGLHMM